MPEPKAAKPNGMHSVDFSAPINDLDGRPIIFGADASAKPLTLATASITALLSELPGEPAPADEKLRRWTLAQKIQGASGPVDLKAEEVVTLRYVIGAGWSTLIMGRSFELLPE